MNIERLTQLAEWLEGGAKHERFEFDMSTGFSFPVTEDFNPDVVPECGAACCIAGAACQFFGDVETLYRLYWEDHYVSEFDDGDMAQLDWLPISDEARVLLGLTDAQAEALFVPTSSPQHLEKSLRDFNDPAWAARTIRRLIETGEVDWMASR